MAIINENYLNLQGSYLFANIAKKVKEYQEMGKAETFRGYGPEQGYDFLRQAIVDGDYKPLGVDIAIDEVFVSDGAKSDVGNIQELFSEDNVIAITDPVYPVYLDSNVMGGRTGAAVDGIFPKGCIPPYLCRK